MHDTTDDFWTRRAARVTGFVAAGVLALVLDGCAGAPPKAYGLHAAASAAHVSRGTLAIDLPDAAPPLDSDFIVVREGGDLLSRLAGAQWAERLTLLVQSRMLQSFENAGLARRVRAAGAPADNRLALEIRRFDIDAPARAARVEISARLVSDSSGRTVAAKIFSASEPVAEIADGAPPRALDRAFGRVSRLIVAWAAGGR